MTNTDITQKNVNNIIVDLHRLRFYGPTTATDAVDFERVPGRVVISTRESLRNCYREYSYLIKGLSEEVPLLDEVWKKILADDPGNTGTDCKYQESFITFGDEVSVYEVEPDVCMEEDFDDISGEIYNYKEVLFSSRFYDCVSINVTRLLKKYPQETVEIFLGSLIYLYPMAHPTESIPGPPNLYYVVVRDDHSFPLYDAFAEPLRLPHIYEKDTVNRLTGFLIEKSQQNSKALKRMHIGLLDGDVTIFGECMKSYLEMGDVASEFVSELFK